MVDGWDDLPRGLRNAAIDAIRARERIVQLLGRTPEQIAESLAPTHDALRRQMIADDESQAALRRKLDLLEPTREMMPTPLAESFLRDQERGLRDELLRSAGLTLGIPRLGLVHDLAAQGAGILVDGTGSSATISNNIVTGRGTGNAGVDEYGIEVNGNDSNGNAGQSPFAITGNTVSVHLPCSQVLNPQAVRQLAVLRDQEAALYRRPGGHQ